MEYFFDKNLKTEELDALVESIGWQRRGENLWRDLLEYFSEEIIYVRDQGKLVGLVRGFSVGKDCFLLGDLVVHSDYQRQGIGTSLLEQIQRQYKNRVFFLEAEPNTVLFYENNGFRKVCNLIFGKVPMKLVENG